MNRTAPSVPAAMTPQKDTALNWIEDHLDRLSAWHSQLWHLAEPAWREYESAELVKGILRDHGFEVEEESGGMPTAFAARFSHGTGGPAIGGYAEYDAVPGNCQAAATSEQPRAGLSRWAAGHTDPHSALAIGSLAGFLGAKEAMTTHGIDGSLVFFGEPAEKVRGSKPLHAAAGYYDGVDAFLSFHPAYMLPFSNTVRWETHCRPNYCMVYTFTCDEPHHWRSAPGGAPIPQAHTAPRAPGANDALVMMYTMGKMTRENILPSDSGWLVSEALLTAGQATADNLPAHVAQLQYACRLADLDQLDTLTQALDRIAESAAQVTGCNWRRDWVSKSRPGLGNHAMAEVTYANMQLTGPPEFGAEAESAAREIQANLGLEPMERPFLPACSELIEPWEAERQLRQTLPPWVKYSTTDDYTEYCWHAPTARMYVGRAMLNAPEGFSYPDWAMNALGGIPETIDPTWRAAGRTISATILDLLTRPDVLADAQREFEDRTGGGIGGAEWIPPLCDYEPPTGFRWPEYVTTPRGREWWIPTTPADTRHGDRSG